MRPILVIFTITLSTVFAQWSSIGPTGGPVYSGDISNTNPPTIYCSPYTYPTKLIKSTDGGNTWIFTPGELSTYPRIIAIHPQNPEIVYALTGSALYRTTNGGASWTAGSVAPSCYLYALALNRLNPAKFYGAGYNYSGGTARAAFCMSTDAGTTWTTIILDTTASSYGYSLAVDPSDTAVIYVGGYRSGGLTTLYRSSDGGNTWEELNLGVNGYYPYALLVSSADPSIILVAPYTSGIYRSTDRGLTWSRVTTVSAVYRLAEAPADPATIYASNSSGIYRSTDRGATWTRIGTNLTGTPYFCLLTSPTAPGTVYLGTTAGLFRSTDYGNTWQELTTDISFNKITALALAGDGSTIYTECQNNAVYRSSDNGTTWERCPEFLSCGNICALAVAPDDPRTVWALEGSG